MAKNKENFYLAKGPNEYYACLFYGEEPPVINRAGEATCTESKCNFVGLFEMCPLADSIKNGEIIKIYIRKSISKK